MKTEALALVKTEALALAKAQRCVLGANEPLETCNAPAGTDRKRTTPESLGNWGYSKLRTRIASRVVLSS